MFTKKLFRKTFVLASLLAGIGNSLAWTTLGIYFTVLSKRYSVIKKVSFINAQTLFFGCFGAMFLTSEHLKEILKLFF